MTRSFPCPLALIIQSSPSSRQFHLSEPHRAWSTAETRFRLQRHQVDGLTMVALAIKIHPRWCHLVVTLLLSLICGISGFTPNIPMLVANDTPRCHSTYSCNPATPCLRHVPVAQPSAFVLRDAAHHQFQHSTSTFWTHTPVPSPPARHAQCRDRANAHPPQSTPHSQACLDDTFFSPPSIHSLRAPMATFRSTASAQAILAMQDDAMSPRRFLLELVSLARSVPHRTSTAVMKMAWEIESLLGLRP